MSALSSQETILLLVGKNRLVERARGEPIARNSACGILAMLNSLHSLKLRQLVILLQAALTRKQFAKNTTQ